MSLIVCLCPTFRRPSALLRNTVACFEAQTYPADQRRLLVLDDAGQWPEQSGPGWQVLSTPDRYPTISAKYNAMVTMSPDADAFVVWDDDDVYLPWHLEAHAAALAEGPWSHPSTVWSLYGKLHQEGAAGRFHGSLAVRREALEQVGGWPDTRDATFDQQLLGSLARQFGPPGDPCRVMAPSYVFRWGSTHSYHAQHFMGKSDWYERAGRVVVRQPGGMIHPQLDAETAGLMTRLTVPNYR